MSSLGSSQHGQKCTLIESIHGEVKLIKRSDDSPTDLESLKLSNLKDCMEYVEKNKFQITVRHLGRKRISGRGEAIEIGKE